VHLVSPQPLPTWLFVCYGGGHVQALLPVAQQVRAQGIARPVCLALTTAAAPVRAAGLEALGFADLVQPGDEAALARGRELAAGLQVQAAALEESVAYLGLSYADLAARLGEAEAAAQYARFGRQAFLPLGPLGRAVDRARPSLVVATNSPRAEQAAIEVARSRGIPSACLVDLLGIFERERLARPDFADAILVLNEGVRASLVAAGRDPTQVRVTGNPAFDSVHAPEMREQGARLRHEAGWDGLHVLLYASSPEPAESPGMAGQGDPAFPRRLEAALVAAVQADPQLALWVRRHPSEGPADAIAALAHPRIRVAGRDMPLHACIHASDEVLVTVSTVGVEASLAGKPVTQLRGSILDALSPYLRLGIARREARLEDIPALYRPGAVRLRPAPDGLADPPAALPGPAASQDAAARVVAVLQSLAERSRP